MQFIVLFSYLHSHLILPLILPSLNLSNNTRPITFFLVSLFPPFYPSSLCSPSSSSPSFLLYFTLPLIFTPSSPSFSPSPSLSSPPTVSPSPSFSSSPSLPPVPPLIPPQGLVPYMQQEGRLML